MAELTTDEVDQIAYALAWEDDERENMEAINATVARIVNARLSGIVDDWVRRVHESHCGKPLTCDNQRNCEGLPRAPEVRLLRAAVRQAGA